MERTWRPAGGRHLGSPVRRLTGPRGGTNPAGSGGGPEGAGVGKMVEHWLHSTVLKA